MLKGIVHIAPMEIEKRSFEIISTILGERKFDLDKESVIKRVIHTTADFDYADNLKISDTALESAKKALKDGADIVTDTTMALSGINKRALTKLGGTVKCFIGDSDVANKAKLQGVTRSSIAIDKACEFENIKIFAIGNAPTALIRLYELIEQKKVNPALVIGAPVGFVNVVESKDLFKNARVPYIIAEGRKGGSNVAAAIVNAILYSLTERE